MLTVNTSGAVSFLASAFFGSSCAEHPINAAHNATHHIRLIATSIAREGACACAMLKAPMAVYDDFAWFYHRYWNEEFHSAALPILERIWLPRIPTRAHILDVCCGSGYLAGLLVDRGYRVTGFDLSPAMIDLARV